MIPAPISVFPAEGRLPAAPPGPPPAGDSGFGAWLDVIAPPDEAGCDQPAVEIPPPDDAVTAVEGEVDIAPIPFAQMQPLPVAAPGMSGVAIAFTGSDGRAVGGIADFGIGEDSGVPLAKASTGADFASVGQAEAGEAVVFDRARAQAAGPEGAAARPVVSVEQMPAPTAISVMPAPVLNARGEAPVQPPTPPAPPPVARQVADAILNIDGDSTEIVLTPPELGAVRIVIARDPHGLVVTLTAERPEALDLLRRHADLLRQDLSSQGDEAARLDFLASGQDEGGRPGGRNVRAEGTFPGRRDDGSIQLEAMMRPVAVPGRIDMRI